jgi:tetratricopeptide (TPR) repeat protein
VARALLAASLLACVLSAQKPPAATPPEPPEEDESLAPKVYDLNPVQAKKEMTAGDYYFKKSNYSAAAKRYLEATRWDPGSAEAFFKLGESREKLHNYPSAREAYSKFLDLGDDAKEKEAIRKKMARWPDAVQSKAAAKK